MLENSRKRARKSKLEVREDIELEEDTVVYMEALDTKVKLEQMIDLGPTTLIGKNKEIQDPSKDAGSSAMDHKPLMEFSVKIEVEECDETGIKENQKKQVKSIVNKKLNHPSKPTNCATTSVFKDAKPTATNINVTTNVLEIKKETEENDVTSTEFKEYVTNRPLMLKISYRLFKSNDIADKLISIEVLNYAGRLLDEPVKELIDVLLCRALEDWRTWHLEHSAVRDTPLVYKCYICGKSWWYMYDFREHMSQHLTLKQFEVSLETNNDECSLVCFQLDVVYNDVELPETNCDRCGKSAESHAFVDNEPYKCLGCQTTFSTCTQLQLHESLCSHYKKKILPDKCEIHKCSVCSFECTERKLAEHMIKKHSVRSDTITTWDLKKCNICARSYILLNLHVCIKRTNNYGCNYCGRSFQKKIHKEMHMDNHYKATECRICHKTLMAKCMEVSHMLQHTDKFALMYKCIQCIEGRFYPDEFSIKHHTAVVHNRPFEKKFKYLEMVILPKQSLEKSLMTSTFENGPDNVNKKVEIGDVAKSNVFVPSTKYRTTQKQLDLPIDVVVKQEPVQDVDIDTLCVTDLSSIKTEAVDETTPHIKISDITSLQEFIIFKTEPAEEVAEDVVIIEDKSETITLYSSADSENDYGLKYTGLKRRRLMRIACICGYVDIRSKVKAHKVDCEVTQTKRAKRQPRPSIAENETVKSKSKFDDEDSGSNVSEDEQDADEDVVNDDNSDEDWGQGVPLERNSKGGLKYTCHCKKVFVGTLAAFRRHKKACVVVARLKQQRKDAKVPAVFTCTKCNTDFNSMLRYTKHFNRVHYFQKSLCPQCLVVFDCLGKLTRHMNLHVSRNYLKMRLISESQEWMKTNKCKVCKKPVDKKDYFKHWESHLVLNIEDMTASRDSDSQPEDDCLVIDTQPTEGKSLYSPELMQRALEWLQSSDGLDSVDEKTCVFCARRFSRKNDSKRHVIEHLLQDAYAQRVHHKSLLCQICFQGFPKDDRFKHHMREHASLPVYQCNLCGKSFSDSSNFCKHRKVHGLSLMSCTVCEKRFHNRSHLDRHMEMHEKTKPIICDTCGKMSYTESAHKKHVRCAHERHKTRMLCPVCRASFTRLKDKWDHMWLVHKERKFNADCPICNLAFRRFADVKSHVKEIHNRSVRLSTDHRMIVYV